MMIHNYNGMNAQDIANKVIAKEEAYNTADVTQMSFEDKCHYALALTPIIHPAVSADRSRRRELLEELRPELLRRAEQEDPFALYVLGNENADLSARPTDAQRRFLERAMNAGYVPAALSLFDLFYSLGKSRSSAEAERVISWLSERINENTPDRTLYDYYSLMNDKAKERELALQLALDGDYGSVVRISNSLRDSLDSTGDERVFWETVHFLILEHFYNNGVTRLGDGLGMKLLNERGCKRDLERIKAIYVDLMMRYAYDRHQLATMLGVPCDGTSKDLYEAERVCRTLIQNGMESNYWRLILLALLSGDRKKVETACDEACRANDGLLAVNVPKAFHMLRQVGKKSA